MFRPPCSQTAASQCILLGFGPAPEPVLACVGLDGHSARGGIFVDVDLHRRLIGKCPQGHFCPCNSFVSNRATKASSINSARSDGHAPNLRTCWTSAARRASCSGVRSIWKPTAVPAVPPPAAMKAGQLALTRIHLGRTFGLLDFVDQFLPGSFGGLEPGVLGFRCGHRDDLPRLGVAEFAVLATASRTAGRFSSRRARRTKSSVRDLKIEVPEWCCG